MKILDSGFRRNDTRNIHTKFRGLKLTALGPTPQTLANASDAALTLIVLPDDCSFSLETAQTTQKAWLPVNNSCDSFQPVDSDVLVLQPREEKIFEIDFSDERWFVRAENTPPVEIGTLDWSEWFRLIYRPPSEAACRHLQDRDLV